MKIAPSLPPCLCLALSSMDCERVRYSVSQHCGLVTLRLAICQWVAHSTTCCDGGLQAQSQIPTGTNSRFHPASADPHPHPPSHSTYWEFAMPRMCCRIWRLS